MKKQILLFLFILLTITLFSKVTYQTRGENLQMTYQNDQNLKSDIYKVIAFPSERIKINVIDIDADSYDNNGKLVGKSALDYTEFISVKDNFIMRELYAHKLLIKNKVKQRNGFFLLKSITVKITAASQIKHITKISKAFLPSYKILADNYQYSYLRNVDFSNPKELIIAHSSLSQYIDLYKEWKMQKGVDVQVAYVEDIGNTNTEIKDYIQTQYNTDNPPDYLLIIGDVDGSFTIPSYYITEENDVTDQIYTELAGNDYFPEMIVGRFSIDQSSEFATMINKVLHYEKEPYMDQTDWYKHIVVVAGNYSPAPPYPSTPVAISQWMADNFRAHGFNNVDEIYYPPTYPGTTEIHSAINQGEAFVTYRGWGDANGWHFPEYHIGEGTETGVIDLTNGFKLPIVTSMVCHTGDFANTYHDPCFGEAWLRAGTATNPKGGVEFVGPSDLHTHTKFNNAIFGGFYKGVLDESIYDFGAAVLRGKIELYNNFPLNQAPGGLVEFYFRVYNILGDPNLQMWTDIPQQISSNIPTTISLGTNYLSLQLPDMDGAVVTAIKDNDNIFARSIVKNGIADLYFNLLSEGNLTVTVTYPNKIPLIQDIQVNQEGIDLGITNIQPQSDVIAGNTVNIDITVKNFGSNTAENVTGTLSSESNYVTINQNSASFGNISPNSQATQSYQITIAGDCPNNQSIPFTLNFGNSDSKFELSTNNISFIITGFSVSPNQYLMPGETAQLSFHLKNTGNFTASGLNIQATATDPVSFDNNTCSIDEIPTGQTADMQFTVTLASDCAVGRTLGFNFAITDSDNRNTTCWYHITAGNVTNTAPTGPDNYGYYAYDSFDTDYDISPDYQWIEINPTEGGSGTLIQMEDDQVETINLPFNFKYYGQQYSQISICSNGWLSFIPTDQIDFINWNIPGALGPYAMVAPYWDDLIGQQTGENQFDPMDISYYHNTTNHTFIVEWDKSYSRFDHTSLEKFEVILFDPSQYQTPTGDGNIQFNYHTINNPDASNNYATVGIENHLQNDGVLYTFASQYPASATQLQNGLSILFTTVKPDNYTFSDNDVISLNKSKIIANNPNPFNPETTISFVLKQDRQTELTIYNLKGEKVKTLINEHLQKGLHQVTWKGMDKNNKPVGSGLYIMVLQSDGKLISTHKALLLK